MSINVKDAPESWYRVTRAARDRGLDKAVKVALEEGLTEEEFMRLAKEAAHTAYLAAMAKKARADARALSLAC